MVSSSTVDVPDFNLTSWVEKKVGQIQTDLPDYLISTLLEELGVAPYLNDPQCTVSTTTTNGWTSGILLYKSYFLSNQK